MNPGTDYITPGERIADRDCRAAMRLTENFDEDGTSSDSWTWVAALLVAALFIVSGYLDQESGILDATPAAGVAEKYASNISAPQASAADSNRAGQQSVKGY